jgi:glutathione synthase/RimK-type ligase-like ATP-grasp enzyme
VQRWVIVGHPEHERVALFQAALARLGHAPAAVLSWRELLEGRAALDDRLPPGACLRIESPGGCFAVERLLLAAGSDEPDERFAAPRLSRAAALALDEDRGRIVHPRQRYLGLRASLLLMARALVARPDVRVMNRPADIAVMGDKAACDERLRARGVARPAVLGSPGSFDELCARARDARCARLFIKLANGSSASGVVAYRSNGRQQIAVTSAELIRAGGGVRLYNSKRVRRYTDAGDVAALCDALCAEGVLVERWIPKAGMDGRTFDLRVVVVGGRARQVAVRTSAGPITNLHLGGDNRRGSIDGARARLGQARFGAALAVAERAAAAFPDSYYAGVDVLCPADGRAAPLVAEVNAFGDHLRRITDRGQDAHEAEVATFTPALAGQAASG